MNFADLQQVLLWLLGMGSPAVVMYVVSFLVENWQQWSLLPHWVKFYGPMLLSILLTVGAAALLKYPAVISSIQPWFQVVVTAIVAYGASQVGYMKVKAAKYGARFVQPKSSPSKKEKI